MPRLTIRPTFTPWRCTIRLSIVVPEYTQLVRPGKACTGIEAPLRERVAR